MSAFDVGGQVKATMLPKEGRRVCGHVLFVPIQAFRRRKGGKWVPFVGDPLYAPIACMSQVGHDGDHRHTFVWSAKNPDEAPNVK